MILTYNNQWLIYDAQVFDNFAEPVRYVYTGPNVSAAPTSGIYDTTINLTHSTPQGYDFVEYSATGANVDGNTFKIGDTDVYVEGVFTDHYYTINTSSSHGTITANHNTAKHGTTITLSNSPASGYDFDYYEVIGATLINDNQFVIGYSDVTVIGHFKSAVKHATVHLRLPDVADTYSYDNKTWYPIYVDELWEVVSYTGDDISYLTKNAETCAISATDAPFVGTTTHHFSHYGTTLDGDKVATIKVYESNGDETHGNHDLRARSNVRDGVIYIREWHNTTEDYELEQVYPRYTQDAAGSWIYERRHGVNNWEGDMSTWVHKARKSAAFYVDGNTYCFPNPYKSYSDVIADLTWTE